MLLLPVAYITTLTGHISSSSFCVFNLFIKTLPFNCMHYRSRFSGITYIINHPLQSHLTIHIHIREASLRLYPLVICHGFH